MTLPKRFETKEQEPIIYKSWEENGYFKPKDRHQSAIDNKPFVVTIPPPNVTGVLHMGHALNNTIQDVLVRWHRMRGDETLWVPGTDHAGIATQNKVEQKLAAKGKTRFDLGRENFIKETWKWKTDYESRILGQLKTMGCSCDWEHTRFTMDEDYSTAVIDTFIHYYEKGYLYRGHRITNWCPRCGTSLSDLEVEHEEKHDFLWHIRYEIEGGGDITVATTRPETMLGDTAIAVNPTDKRYKGLVGKIAILPIAGRKVPIIVDDYVDATFGTGAVKVTPAHDPNDYEIGERHKLEKIVVIGLDGKMTTDAGEQFAGQDRYEAREEVLRLLEEGNWLVKTVPHTHSVGHCYRCHTAIEPLLSLQWFVNMKELAKPAIKAVKDGEVVFHPAKWSKVYLDWMENIHDWCISRQIWWGHQIPAWYCECGEIIVSREWADEDTKDKNNSSLSSLVASPGIPCGPVGGDPHLRKDDERKCPKCASSKLVRDPDVLDTWFSSALWPFATLGGPSNTPDMDKFYPTSFISTARDIIFLWVARMIISGIEFTGKIPFQDVYIHATVFNSEGKRMSKSLGTGVDPLDLIAKYGTDATRFGLLWQVSQGQDMKFGEDALLMSSRFVNKVWNASKFVMSNLEDYPLLSARSNVSRLPCHSIVSRETIATAGETSPSRHSREGGNPVLGLTKADKEILAKLAETIKKTDKYLGKYDFQHAAELLYEFFWHDFCDKCIEDTKVRIRDNASSKLAAQYTLDTVLKTSLKLLHPFMPFVTEAIWSGLEEETQLIITRWPK